MHCKQSTLLCAYDLCYDGQNSEMRTTVYHKTNLKVVLQTSIGDFTVTSFAVSRGHPAPLVGKRLLAGGLRVYFCLDSCLVYINFAHTQDHDYVLYLCGGTSGVVWTACFSLLSSKKMENEENSG